MNKYISSDDSNASVELSCFKVNLAVRYQVPQTFNDPDGKPLVSAGYFRKFVVVAKSEEEARSMLLKEAEDGQVDWRDSNVERVTLNDLTECSIKREDLPTKSSIVFRSGRFLYP